MLLPKVEMTVFETILARRSVRKFKARQLDQVTIRTLLEAAVRAPTAVHQEPWAFVTIQDKKLLQTISETAKPLFVNEIQRRTLHADQKMDIFSHPDFNIFYNAGTLILICGEATAPFVEADCWLAAENLMLAACAMGLGSCVIGSALPAFSVAKIRNQLSIPADFTVIAPIILGYPDDVITPALRKTPVLLAKIQATVSN